MANDQSSQPTRAEALNPLPDVHGLEGRLRDTMVSCIEPKLPFASVVAIPVTEDGAGIGRSRNSYSGE